MSPLETDRAASSRGLATGALLVGVPGTLVVCLLFGLGMATGAGRPLALAAALALVVLPITGIGAAMRWLGFGGRPATGGSRARVVAATWIWSLAILLAVPSFAPGERSRAARRGADALFARHLGPLREPVRGAVGWLAGLLGDEGGAPTQPTAHTPPASPPRVERPALTAPSAPATPAPARALPPRDQPAPPALPPGEAAPVVLAYRGDGRELDVEVALDGPDLGEHFRMIFDTGASFTTVTPEALAEIGVRVPPDAPRVTLNTAGGQIDAPLVLLDAVWLGDAPIEWVTVAACPSCTAPGRAGLLGLNVSSQFRVEIDHERKRIHLAPSPGDRRHDVRPWLDLRARGTQHGDERLEFEVSVANRAPRAIASATIEIDCGEGGYAVELTGIPAHGEQTTTLTLPGTERCESFRLGLLSAHWVLDRF